VRRSPGRLAWRALLRFLEHNGPDHAAAVSYYTLLSLLPLLIFVISIAFAFVGSFERAYTGTLFLFQGIISHLDEASQKSLHEFVGRANRFQWPGLVLLAWTARRTFASLFAALERVFEVPSLGFARGNLVALAMVLTTGIAVLATLTFTMVLAASEGLAMRIAAGWTGAVVFRNLTVTILSRLLPPLVTLTFFFLLYRIVPRGRVQTSQAAVGAVLATLLWETAKMGFAYYVRNLAHYAGVYGTLEGVLVLALWLELSVSIILYCGEVVALLGESAAQA
jgi:membrane protein